MLLAMLPALEMLDRVDSLPRLTRARPVLRIVRGDMIGVAVCPDERDRRAARTAPGAAGRVGLREAEGALLLQVGAVASTIWDRARPSSRTLFGSSNCGAGRTVGAVDRVVMSRRPLLPMHGVTAALNTNSREEAYAGPRRLLL